MHINVMHQYDNMILCVGRSPASPALERVGGLAASDETAQVSSKRKCSPLGFDFRWAGDVGQQWRGKGRRQRDHTGASWMKIQIQR